MNKLLKIKKIRKKLLNKQPTIGSWMQIPDPAVAEIMGSSNFDWVAVDMEHGSIGIHQLPNLFRSLELGDTLPLVRMQEGTERYCARILDSGAAGIIVPMVESAEQLIKIRDASCWPPSGKRGVGFSRANLYGNNFEEYKKEAGNPLLIAMIENIKALDNLENILKVKGLDSIMIGPYDLSASLGITGDFSNTLFKKTINTIKGLSQENGVPIGFHVVNPSKKEVHSKVKEGYQFIAHSIDSVLLLDSIKNLEF